MVKLVHPENGARVIPFPASRSRKEYLMAEEMGVEDAGRGA